jgi:hypothetical protein
MHQLEKRDALDERELSTAENSVGSTHGAEFDPKACFHARRAWH